MIELMKTMSQPLLMGVVLIQVTSLPRRRPAIPMQKEEHPRQQNAQVLPSAYPAGHQCESVLCGLVVCDCLE